MDGDRDCDLRRKLLNKSIETTALKLWTSEVFNDNPQIEHLGLTTFSGNPRMMKAAEKIGFIQEARIRKV